MEAALKGAEQIGFTILSLTVSLIAVLIPLLFMGDVVGRLFREFAVTLAVTIVVSAVVSLTLTPMMASRILKHNPQEQQGRFYQASERVFEAMIAFYGRTLKFVLRLSDDHAAGRGRDTVADGFPVHHYSEGLFSRAGHGHDPGDFAGAARPSARRPWRRSSRSLRRSSCRIRRWRACRRLSARMAPTSRRTAEECRSI